MSHKMESQMTLTLKVNSGSWRLNCQLCGILKWYLTPEQAQAGALKHDREAHANGGPA